MDEYERWAKRQLEPALGEMTFADRAGGPPGQHDFNATLSDGSVAAIEVTSVVDGDRRNLSASIEKKNLGRFRVGCSQRLWLVTLLPSAEVRTLSTQALEPLIGDLEAEERTSAAHFGDYRDPWVKRLAVLGIESIHGVAASPGSEGLVYVRAGTYGGRGWTQEDVDNWLASFLASPQGANKIKKLANATSAHQKHLVVVLDSFSEAGMGISLALTARRERGAAAYRVPTVTPTEPVTHLWLIPDVDKSDGLLWVCEEHGWRVLSPVPFAEGE
ncbi:hypothetical protein ACIBG5_37215 [Kribbella sp. NPDC050241]|uniref:hypothetical protein n=1 Tax=Kribbella sp. NPDC050241 TaxID=3364115 RepID=UPI0037BDF6E0